MKDANSVKTRENIAKCIWKTDEFGSPDMNILKIDSQVATDKDKDEFLSILKSGMVTSEQKSKYADNYRFFQKEIDKFLKQYPSYFPYLPIRILNNCILLPIEAESQDTALRIFSTLNDRGKPLSDADIFKAQFYKFYSKLGKKDEFITQWKELEELAEKIFHPIYGTPMDELFSRYMYYERALKEIKSSTTEALRKFYERDGYKLLQSTATFENLKLLASFWNDVSNQNKERFSDKVLRRLFVLNYAPNSMWTYFTSVYFMHYKDEDGSLEDDKFYTFLCKTTAFVWAYTMALLSPLAMASSTPSGRVPPSIPGSMGSPAIPSMGRGLWGAWLGSNTEVISCLIPPEEVSIFRSASTTVAIRATHSTMHNTKDSSCMPIRRAIWGLRRCFFSGCTGVGMGGCTSRGGMPS